MATEENVKTMNAVAGADLSASQYLFVVQSSTARQVTVAGTAGLSCLGVLLNDPVSGQAACVAINGRVKVFAGASFDPGVKVMTDNAGKATTATSTNNVMGTAVTAGVNGQICEIMLDKSGVV